MTHLCDSVQDLERRLERRLRDQLPGTAGHLRMSPEPRAGWVPGTWPDDARDGAALLLIYPHRDTAHVVLTLRHGELRSHANQVSLPGGAVDAGESLEEAALREAHEETGVDPRDVRTLGGLSPLHIPVSRFVLHPIVGVTPRRPDLRPEPREVARILEVPLAELANPGRQRSEHRTYRQQVYDVPYFDVEDQKVWGATAMILAEFLTVLGCPPRPLRNDVPPLADD